MLAEFMRWAKGDPILASRLQRMVREITAARQWRVTGNVKFKQTDTGQALYVPHNFWTGVVWFANDIVKDYSKVGADPTAAADPAWVANNVQGIYLVVNLTTGACSWSDDATTLDNTNEQAFWVADSDGAGGYTLNHHTQGDIHARIT